MHEFINKVQKQQEEFEEFSEISVKRCVEVSPSSCQPSVKRRRVTGISGKPLVLEVEQNVQIQFLLSMAVAPNSGQKASLETLFSFFANFEDTMRCLEKIPPIFKF